jgi:hypothetical protein
MALPQIGCGRSKIFLFHSMPDIISSRCAKFQHIWTKKTEQKLLKTIFPKKNYMDFKKTFKQVEFLELFNVQRYKYLVSLERY